MIEDNRILVDIGNGYSVAMRFSLPDEDIDLDALLRIDIANLAAEIVTIPIALNKFGLLLADATSNHNRSKMNLYIAESKKREEIRDDKTIKEKKTELYFNDQVVLDKKCQALKILMYKRSKEMEYMNSIYWSLKSKDDKLNKLSLTLQSGDIYDQLVATRIKRINCVDIKIVKPLIP